MRRDELEHAIRAATQIIKQDQVIIIGSQSILGSFTEDQLPAVATMSPEVDIAPIRDVDTEALSDQLSFDAGELSEFHNEYGFYIEGVGRRTAILPPDWEYRLVGLRSEATNNATGLCLEPHDLCAAKLMADRQKDFDFVRALVEARLVDPAILEQRLTSIDVAKIDSDQGEEALAYRRRKYIAWAKEVQTPAPGALPTNPEE